MFVSAVFANLVSATAICWQWPIRMVWRNGLASYDGDTIQYVYYYYFMSTSILQAGWLAIHATSIIVRLMCAHGMLVIYVCVVLWNVIELVVPVCLSLMVSFNIYFPSLSRYGKQLTHFHADGVEYWWNDEGETKVCGSSCPFVWVLHLVSFRVNIF